MTHATEEPPAKLRITCPCGKRYAVPRSVCGRKVRCGRCQRRLLVGTKLKQQPAPAALALAPTPARPALDLAPAPTLELAPVPTRPVLDLAPAPARRSSERADRSPYEPPSSASKPSRRRRTHQGLFRQRDLAAEGHIRAIGFWTSVWSGLMLLAALGLCALAGSSLFFVVFVLPGVAFLGFTAFLGTKLIQQVNWARIVFAVFSGLEIAHSLYLLLVLTWAGESLLARGVVILWLFWLGAQLWALFSARASRVFQPAYQAKRVRDGRTVAFWWSPFFLIPPLVLITGLLVLVKLYTVLVPTF